MARIKPRPVGRPRLKGKGHHYIKHILKSISVEKKIEVLSFWASAPLPKMRHTIEHFWHDLAPNSAKCYVCRLADVAWNYPFKAGLRKCWLADLQEQLQRPRAEGEKFKLIPPGHSGMCQWVRSIWDALSAQTFANGYMKCGLQLDIDCIAAASLVDELKRLSLVGPAVDDDQDFDRITDEVAKDRTGDHIVEEAVV
ncbi:hypothetical protein PC116_g25864 [Phytophthora cactorum]|nr:hypothetical protein PC116_g25864 [Phytophthora cactorum]